jgi:predicted nucleic acid-binding protein
VQSRVKADGLLFDLPAHTLEEQRDERRRTIQERCEKAAEIANITKDSVVAWCNLNDESELLRHLITDSVEVSGSDSDEKKEEAFQAFESGEVRVMITKPTIGGFGLNWQHCARQTFFPSHSFEQWYQAIRRSWRFGQTRKVQVDVITTEGESRVLSNLERKAKAADKMFDQLVELMNKSLRIDNTYNFNHREEIPSWL